MKRPGAPLTSSCWDNLPASGVHKLLPTQPPQNAIAGQQAAPQASTPAGQQATGHVRPVLSGVQAANPGVKSAAGSAGETPSPAGKVDHRTLERGAADRIRGLGALPAAWPKLPANASLAAEVAWVQSNRLAIVEEKPSGGIHVHLDRAHEPAPSRAAIGWLETSIRSYAKWVEVAAKASGMEQDDQAYAKRERARIEDIRAVLAEMLEERGE